MWVVDVLTTTDTMWRTNVGEGELVALGRQDPSSGGRGGRHDGHGGRGRRALVMGKGKMALLASRRESPSS
jgi:hypothetical protein